jgi:hypothetical protein
MDDPWKVLTPELSEDSIPALLPLSLPLEINSDKFYLTIIAAMVKNMVFRLLLPLIFFS